MRRSSLLVLLVAACSGLGQADIYAGPVTPQAGACDPPAQGVLSLRKDMVIFAPDSGTLELRGRRDGRHVSASLGLVGADRKPYRLAFTGDLQGRVITGSYTTPRCRYRVALKLTAD